MTTKAEQSKTVLVTGATGRQGSRVASRLLARRHTVRALTRKPDSPAALTLEQQGVHIVKGDFATMPPTAFRGVDAIFLMSTFYEAGADAEARNGLSAISAIKAAGVPHVVYNSVAHANENTGIPHFDSKHEVEEALRQSGVPYTIFGPTAFMDNLLAPWVVPQLKSGILASPVPTGKYQQWVSLDDLAQLDTLAIEDPERLHNKRLDVASDASTPEDTARLISAASGLEIQAFEMTHDQMYLAGRDVGLMNEWMAKRGYHVDIRKLHDEFGSIGWTTLESWVNKQDWRRAFASRSTTSWSAPPAREGHQ